MQVAFVGQRKALWPTAIFELAVEHEAHGAFQWFAQALRAAFEVKPQQELRRFTCAGVIEGGVAVIVMEFFEAPAVLADGVVPAARRCFAREIVMIIPAARRMLRGYQAIGHIHSGLVVELVARGVKAIEIEMPNRRGTRRLDPDHGGKRFHLAPAAREVSGVAPHVAAAIRHALAHEARGALHHGQSFRIGSARGRARRQHACADRTHDEPAPRRSP